MEVEAYEDDIFFDGLGLRVWEKRHIKVGELLELHNITKVCDIGCNDGKFIRRLTRDERYDLIGGLDVDKQALQVAEKNSAPEGYHFISPSKKEAALRVLLFSTSILRDCSFMSKYEFEAITLIEVIEHIEIEQLENLELNVFGIISPKLVIVTTPNYEFNGFFQDVEKPEFRHDDHKFEWVREEFTNWAERISTTFGYNVSYDGVGLPKTGDTSRGFCSQIAIFEKKENNRPDTKHYKTLESQEENIFLDITYPVKKITSKENFIAELNYAYYFVLTYTDYDFEAEDQTENSNNGFLKIEDLVKIRGLEELLKESPDSFLELVEKYLPAEEYQISMDRKRFKLIAKKDNDDEEDDNY